MKILLLSIPILFLLSTTTICQNKKLFLIGGDIGGMYIENSVSNLTINNNAYNKVEDYPTNSVARFGSNASDYNRFYIAMNPNVSYYITDNLLLGLGFELLYDITNYENDIIEKAKTTSYFISPLIRYYYYKGLFAQLQYNVGKSFQMIDSDKINIPTYSGYTSLDYSYENRSNTNGFAVSAGYSIELSDKIFTDVALKYFHHKNKVKFESTSDIGNYDNKQNGFLITIGLKFQITN